MAPEKAIPLLGIKEWAQQTTANTTTKKQLLSKSYFLLHGYQFVMPR